MTRFGIAAAGVAVLAVLALFDPAATTLFPPCFWRAATGWLCPGCGSARALHALLHGHLDVAVHANPLAVAAMPLAAFDFARRFSGRGDSILNRVPAIYLYALAIGLVMFGILRNV